MYPHYPEGSQSHQNNIYLPNSTKIQDMNNKKIVLHFFPLGARIFFAYTLQRE